MRAIFETTGRRQVEIHYVNGGTPRIVEENIEEYFLGPNDFSVEEILQDQVNCLKQELQLLALQLSLEVVQDYEMLATAYKMEEDVVIAKLNAEKHKDLADRYDISGYPMVKFFPKHNKDGEDYDGELDLEDFILFINEHCDTGRDPNGKLTSDAGIVESLHLLVKDFFSGSIDEKKEILSQIQEEVEDLEGPAERDISRCRFVIPS